MRAALRASCGLVLCCGLTAVLPSCGDPEPEPAPSQAVAGPASAASKEGKETEAGRVLRQLRTRVHGGQGGPEVNQEIAALQRLLWPALDTPEAQQASDAHVTLSHTAGAVAKTIALPAEVRAQVGEIDAISLEIHEAWLEAAAGTPEEYAVWCSHQGAALLLRLRADRAKLWDTPRARDEVGPPDGR
jgi:hypothetical protein